MKIEYIANNGKNSVSAPTAHEAASRFLATFKNRTFSVCEWRDGRFFFECFGDGNPENNCFHINFRSRVEAQQFIDNVLNVNQKSVA